MKFVSTEDIDASGNDVVEHFAELGATLKVTILEESDVLIEGDAVGLGFLANQILSLIKGDEHSRNIHPDGPGNIFFRDGSTHGLYIHVLPCRHGHQD